MDDPPSTANAPPPEPPSSSSSSSSSSSTQQQSSNPTTDNALVGRDALQNTATWTQWLPAGPIRQAVEASKYRWCAREAGLWGIATGTAMALHRWRMASPITTIGHVGFVTTVVVYSGSYYFCTKRRDYQEQMIALMMQLNSFEPVANMPEERPLDAHHPFVAPAPLNDDSLSNVIPQRQYVANLPERKEWQAPLPTQDAQQVFRPAAATDNNNNNSR